MGVSAGLYMCDVVKKSSRSLSHLMMSSCLFIKKVGESFLLLFSEREVRELVRYMLSPVRLSVYLSVTLVHPTQAVEIFDNISTALGTLTIR